MKMQTFRKPHQWLNFWLEKYSDLLSSLKYSGEQRKKYWAVMKVFLEELPGNPRNIPLEAVEKFVTENLKERLLPISLFYKQIAPSKPHMELLRKLTPPETVDEAIAEQDPVDWFRELLEEEKFSPRTVKNYTASLSAFIKWLGTDKDCTAETIDPYCDYLAQEKHLAPRTVALHSAALKLYFKRTTTTGK
jgi:hypothetical protein